MTEKDTETTKQSNVKKFGIICKFFMTGACKKEETCPYLHESWIFNPLPAKECPYFKLGYCKKGKNCENTHTQSESIPEILPIWYIEYLQDKKSNEIFTEFQSKNEEEIRKLEEYYNKEFVESIYSDILSENHKKDLIMEVLLTKIRYFFLRFNNIETIKFSQSLNFIPLSVEFRLKLEEVSKNCENVFLLIYDNSSNNFKGFGRLIKNPKKSVDQESCLIPFEYIWRDTISDEKLKFLRNSMNGDKPISETNNYEEIPNETGSFVCKYMMKKLEKQEYLKERDRHVEMDLVTKIMLESEETKDKGNEDTTSMKTNDSNKNSVISLNSERKFHRNEVKNNLSMLRKEEEPRKHIMLVQKRERSRSKELKVSKKIVLQNSNKVIEIKKKITLKNNYR